MNCVRRSQPNNNKGEEEAPRWIHMILIIKHDSQLEEPLISARLEEATVSFIAPRPNNDDQRPMTHPHTKTFSFLSKRNLAKTPQITWEQANLEASEQMIFIL